MYDVYRAPITTGAQETGVLTDGPSQRRAVKSTGPDDVRACGSARIGARTQRSPCPCEGGLHMGERRSDGVGASFRWNSANPPASSKLVDALPCAQTPLCAHGSRQSTLTDIRDTAESCGKSTFIPVGSFSPMCNPSAPPPSRREGTAEAPAQGRRISQASLTLATAIPWRGAAS